MSRAVDFSEEAGDDVSFAARYYAGMRPGLGGEFSDAVVDLAYELADHPRRGREIRPGVRQTVLRRFPYLIFYAVEGERLIVIAVISSARDPTYIDRVLSERRI